MIRKTVARRFLAATALATAGVMAASGSAVAAPATVPFLCRVPENGVWTEYGSNRVFDVTAPATVQAGTKFKVTYAQGPFTLNPEYQQEVKDIAVKINQPAGAHLVSLKLTGGSNLGNSTRSVVSVNGKLTLRAGGPFYGGTTFELPVIEAVYTAPAGRHARHLRRRYRLRRHRPEHEASGHQHQRVHLGPVLSGSGHTGSAVQHHRAVISYR
ncbi:hypothetical protein NEH83_21180 [Streptomyces sp. JUS-F4]|uniref:hypothetical protein n=1 Tax=Streptomyces sp. JUS-F4 TaxID=2951988 RepID=UPI0026660D4B|nr:hypothetical protein [Streptomyces sp. JUS-F4]WKN16466.1 hypothetical protein NEH83_21180 [Streptomyces sp. JUS-F4]